MENFHYRSDKEHEFKNVNNLFALKKKKAGQGLGWSDTKILRNAGITVLEGRKIENVFSMTIKKRFDFFPLGANEAHSLLDIFEPNNPELTIEPRILLIYPFGRLFFVHKDNKELHDIIKKGLDVSFINGSFLELFKSHPSNQALFEKANLADRIQIRIDNPNMTERFKAIPSGYFFNLDMLED